MPENPNNEDMLVVIPNSISKFEQTKTMKFIVTIFITTIIFTSCSKDKFTTEPQIKFEKISPNSFSSSFNQLYKNSAPKLTFKLTDEEGDVGIKNDTVYSKVFVKNLNTNDIDSMKFPSLGSYTAKRFEGEVTINLFDFLSCASGGVRPRTDTTYFEVYVTDFANNKSNVLKTSDPVYYTCE